MDQWVWALLLHLPLHHRLPCTSEAPSNPCTGNHLARTHNHTCREPCTSFGLIHSLSMITIYFNSHTFLIQLFFFTFFFVESLLSLRRLFLFVSQLTVEIALLHHGRFLGQEKIVSCIAVMFVPVCRHGPPPPPPPPGHPGFRGRPPHPRGRGMPPLGPPRHFHPRGPRG